MITTNGSLNQPNPNLLTDSDLTTMIQEFNENFTTLNTEGMGVRSGYYETVLINNGNTPKTLVKTTKNTCVDSIATDAALTVKLPATLHLNGDCYTFADGANNVFTYNFTVDVNGNPVNGVVANLVLNQNKSWIKIEWINESIGFVVVASSAIVAAQLPPVERVLVVVDPFAIDEIINITDGTGSITGTCSVTGSSLALPVSDAIFKSNAIVQVYKNGRKLSKTGTQLTVIWDSTNSFHLNVALAVDDELCIIAPQGY